WTGVNQLLVYRNNLKSGWYDVNPNTPEYTIGSDFQWGTIQPEGYEPVTTYTQSAKTYNDYPMVITDGPYAVFCEYGGPLAKTTMGIKFRSTFPVPLTNFVQSNPLFYGCFSEILPNLTPIQCAFACARDVACRSVYISQPGGECVRMMYADSLLPASQTGGKTRWARFAKTYTPTPGTNP
ncbi:uncharacterized protein DEA37_0012156, partial [Paragonimus westermani]